MKRKIPKIMGVALTLVLLASFLMVAAPVSAGTLSYSTVTTPRSTYQQLQELSDVDELALAPDGSTMFAYDNESMTLYKSTNAGVTFSSTSIGTGIEGTVIEDCEDVWVVGAGEAANVTVTLDNDVGDFKVGTGSASLAIAAGYTANALVASEVVTEVDLTGYQAVKLWIKSTVVAAAGDLDILIDETALCATPDRLDIPAVAVADTWYHLTASLAGVAAADRNAIISVGFSDDTDLGAVTVHLDDIRACSYDVTGVAISPEYATDSTLVITTEDRVFRSINGGTSFGEVSTTLLQTAIGTYAAGKRITSVDLATYYTGGQLAILIGTYDTGDDQYGGVYVGRLDTWTWVDQAIGNYDVQAVAFSPNHAADAQILVVAADAATATYLMTKFTTNAWAADVLTATLATAIHDEDLTHACIAFPDDYEWSSNNQVFVGIADSVDATAAANGDDIFRVLGGLPGGASTAYDLNLNGTSADADIYSIAVSGNAVGASVVVGQQNSTTVKRTSDPTTSTVTWSSNVKAPIGDAADPDTIVIMAPDFATSNKVYAATDGTNSCLSVSDDGSIYFDGLSLIQVSDTLMIDYLGSAIVDANTMYLLIHDNADAGAVRDFDANETQMVFKTTDGGTSWIRVHFHLSTGTEGLSILQASPEYATDSTVYVAQDDTRMWRSTDAGKRFIGLAAPAAVTALAVVDGTTYFTGHANSRIYKSGHWNYGTAADSIQSISVIDEDTVLIGNNDGDVYLSTNASATSSVLYTRQGVAEELGDAATIVPIADPSYATNSTIYATTSANTIGIRRWVVGTSTTWSEIDGANTSLEPMADLIGSGIAVADDGSLYVAINVAAKGIRRSTAPTSATVAGRDFEPMVTLLPTNALLSNLAYIPGSNVLYTIATGCAASSSYPHGYRLLSITDTFSITPTMTAPEEGASVGTTVSLSWEAIPAPAGTTVTYTYEVSYDAAYSNDFVAPTGTTGTTVVVTGLTAGRTWYWRMFVDDGDPLKTRYAKGSFIVKLSAAALSLDLGAPAPGATGVSLAPNFQWSPIAGATGYRLEIADNAAFTGATSMLVDSNVWAASDLAYSTVYYWRVKAISGDTESSWANAVFTTMAEPVAPVPPVTIQPAPPAVTPQVTVTVQPAPVTTPEPTPGVTPGWIYAIIAVGAVLVIAVIVLIVRTRRVV